VEGALPLQLSLYFRQITPAAIFTMPPSHEILTDEYVAELLAKEANDCSLKYSAMGLDAFKTNT
jgi:hypothetical protein